MRALLGDGRDGVGCGPVGLVQEGVAGVEGGKVVPVAELFCFDVSVFPTLKVIHRTPRTGIRRCELTHLLPSLPVWIILAARVKRVPHDQDGENPR